MEEESIIEINFVPSETAFKREIQRRNKTIENILLTLVWHSVNKDRSNANCEPISGLLVIFLQQET